MKAKPNDFIPTQQSSASEWQEWYDSLRANFPKTTANQLWLKAWAARQSAKARTAELSEYMKKEGGINIELGLIESAKEGLDAFGDSIGDFFGMTKTIAFVVGGLVLVPVVILLFNVARNPIGSANATANVMKSSKGM